jgi:hypothetical protein
MARQGWALAAAAGLLGAALAGCPRGGDGDACQNNGDCRPPLYCDPAAGVCRTPAGPSDAGPEAGTDAGADAGAVATDAGDAGGGGATDAGDAGGGGDGGTASVPGVPVPRRPMNASYTGDPFVSGSRRPSFVWEAPTGGSGAYAYDLQYGTDPTFVAGTTTAPALTTTSYAPPADLFNGRWWWHVRACDAAAPAVCSAYSPAWYVNVGRSDRDFNGDGCGDAVVGAWGNDAAAAGGGSVYLYLGELFAPFDTNADFTFTGGDAGGAFGHAVGAADVNGDGLADLLVGAPHDGDPSVPGQVLLYLAGPLDQTPDAVLVGEVAGDRFGAAVGSAGDVDGDGYADVIVGAPGSDAGGAGAGAGRVYVYRGGPPPFDTTPDWILDGAAAADAFGTVAGGAGDVNGDGFGDVLVGAPGYDFLSADVGGLFVYYGGPGPTFDPIANGTIAGAGAGDALGGGGAGVGDVNGDGYADVVAGAPLDDTVASNAGAAYVFLGGSGAGFDVVADATLLGEAGGDHFGASVAWAGDVDADGYDDVLVGAPYNDAGGVHPGRAYVFRGGSGASFDPAADGTLTGVGADGLFGAAVASAGDVDGDGDDDLVVGAPGALLSTGVAYLYLGAAGAAFDPGPDAPLTALSAADLFGGAVY